jgi:hypothetical protein
LELPNIYVDCGDGECKIWLQPVRLARAENVAPFQVRRIEREIAARQACFVEQYHAFFIRCVGAARRPRLDGWPHSARRGDRWAAYCHLPD